MRMCEICYLDEFGLENNEKKIFLIYEESHT